MKPLNKTLRIICILHLLSGGIIAQAQELKERQLNTLSKLGVPPQNFDLTNDKINADFQNILKLEKRRKGQKIAGSILLPIGLAIAGLGASMISSNQDIQQIEVDGPNGPELVESEDRYRSFNNAIGSTLLVIGVGKIVVSVPILVFSGKKKRKRDRLLAKYTMAMEKN